MTDTMGGGSSSSSNGYDPSGGLGVGSGEQPDGLVLVWSMGLPSR
jgi:hypothetical protein